MWWIICFRTLSNKTINEIMPNIEREYTLTQTTPIKYDNIDECLITELHLPKNIIQSLIDAYRSLPTWKEISQKNFDHIYKDINNPLTEDEKFAIFLYTIDEYFYNTLSQVLNLGTTGQFNCYFQYLISGFDKIKSGVTENMILYRGVTRSSHSVNYINYKKGDKVLTTSFTSTSSVEKVAYSFSGGLLFKIKAKRNAKSVQELSHYHRENEFLYPPVTKFIVTDDPYESWCYYDSDRNELHCAKDEEYDYFDLYMVVPLEEVDDDYGPIETAKDDSNLNQNHTKYKNIDWWGWMAIGIAIGIMFTLLIVMIVILTIKACKNNNSENTNSEISSA